MAHSNTFEEAQNIEIEINFEIGYVECQPSLNLSKSIYKKHEKTHNSPQKTTKKLINLVRKQKYYIFIMEQHVFNSCYGVGAKQARVQSLH
jgi:hypothetical protein